MWLLHWVVRVTVFSLLVTELSQSSVFELLFIWSFCKLAWIVRFWLLLNFFTSLWSVEDDFFSCWLFLSFLFLDWVQSLLVQHFKASRVSEVPQIVPLWRSLLKFFECFWKVESVPFFEICERCFSKNKRSDYKHLLPSLSLTYEVFYCSGVLLERNRFFFNS